MRFLVLGHAGFIGSNLCLRLMKDGHEVTGVDPSKHPIWLDGMRYYQLSLGHLTEKELFGYDVIVHLAAQTAVTKSIQDPLYDFKVNLHDTVRILEYLRHSENPPILLYASTNKVYGNNPEYHKLDFKTPYACSKGAAEQYVLDYYHTFGLRTVSFRQSCIYGPYQWGSEDQGWIAWIMRAALTGQQITVYGDGHQVRDILYVDDMVDAYLTAIDRIELAKGKAYDIGGGWESQISVNELIEWVENKLEKKIQVKYASVRLNDQNRYISHTGEAFKDLDWMPQVSREEGLNRMWEWVKSVNQVEA